MKILFRCDGSIEIGMGHVVRCLALADELFDNHDCEVSFALRKSELAIKHIKSSYPVLTSNENSFDYNDWIVECIRMSKAQILILDVRDNLSRSDLIHIKKKSGVRVVTIDDPEDKRLESDLAFFPPVPQVQEMGWHEYKGKLFVGWAYVILRKEFNKYYPDPNNDTPNILVSMGGTDEHNMTQMAIEAFNLINHKVTVTIILGPGYQFENTLRKLLFSAQFKYTIYRNPSNIASLMSNSNLAVISFGQTAYELAALRVPSIYMCLTEDHYDSSMLFVSVGVGVNIGLTSKMTPQFISNNVVSILIDEMKMKMMRKHAKDLSISDLKDLSHHILRNI
jgi:UDP-2,4-diacetamido-2,4,6-trideoxy-beta-L-altropyranose hydrolase